MKKTILILFMFLSALSINAQETIVKILLGDGSNKTYSLNDIQNLSFTKYQSNALLNLYFRNTQTESLAISNIDSINFESEQATVINLVLYTFETTPKKYLLSDIDSLIITINNDFETVTIGSQIWIERNLDVSTYRNGDTIRHAVSNADWIDAYKKKEGAWCYYNNDPATGAIYGKLYNWYAVNDSRGLAPSGFHVASDAEWTTLTDYLGGSSVAGGAMKEAGTSHWASPNKGATNSSSFTALPGGCRNREGSFFDLNTWGYWWSADVTGNSDAWYNYLTSGSTYLNSDSDSMVLGHSVRCLKD